MAIYKLTLATIVSRKTFAIFVVLFAVLPLVLPLMTPWEENQTLLEPARAQTAWALLWFVALGWILYQGASFGDKCAAHGVLEYCKTMGMKRLSQIGQIWLSCGTFLGLFLLVAVGICLLAAMPHHPDEARMWIYTNVQYALLFLLVVAPLLLLAIALGTRMNPTAAYVISAGLGLYGLFGIGYLDFFLAHSGNPVVDFIYVVSPQYHLADLTDRLVFKMGALSGKSFLLMTGYLFGLGLIIAPVAFSLFRVKK